MFELTETAIDIDSLKEKLRDERAGALIFFEGVVRNHNEGKKSRPCATKLTNPWPGPKPSAYLPRCEGALT